MDKTQNPSEVVVETPQNPIEQVEVVFEGNKVEQVAEQPVLSVEEQLKNLDVSSDVQQQKIIRMNQYVEDTQSKLKEVRESLGLPPMKEDPRSISDDKEKLEKLKAEQEVLEKQKEELVSKQEREKLIKVEKEKILQEKLNELFAQFKKLQIEGKTPSVPAPGRGTEDYFKSAANFGTINDLFNAFNKGITSLPEILKAFPKLMEQLDKEIEREATERVDKMIKEEKEKVEKGEEKDKKPEEIKPKEEQENIPVEETKQGETISEETPITGVGEITE